jgi:hypothetical protein
VVAIGQELSTTPEQKFLFYLKKALWKKKNKILESFQV